jgi:transcriptional regulator with XRE-family HTH domain
MARSSRSLRVRQDCIDIVKNALRRNYYLKQSDLAIELGFARSTVNNFLNGKPVNSTNFEEICDRLALDWQDIADLNIEVSSQNTYKRQDWGEAVDVSVFYGRSEELTTLRQWIVGDCYRSIAVFGMGGIGKTTLTVKLAEDIQDEFECLIWRSLRNSPPLEELLKDAIATFSEQQTIALPDTIDAQIALLMQCLRQSRCLLILDNFESILDSEQLAGTYRQGYEGYQQLLRCVSETKHQSCLLLTTRELSRDIAIKESSDSFVRSLQLTGLKPKECREILLAKSLSSSIEEIVSLTNDYAGNPLALQMTANYILEGFEGNTDRFLQYKIIGRELRDLLDCQFDRLSSLEKQVMYWLAISRDEMSLEDLQSCLISTFAIGDLLDALTSLRSRSLIEKNTSLYFQHPVIMEYVTERFLRQIEQELMAGKIDLLNSFKLLTIEKENYIRKEQLRLILQPIAERLLTLLGNLETAKDRLKEILEEMEISTHRYVGYASENLTILTNFLSNGSIIGDPIRQAILLNEPKESLDVIRKPIEFD